jgi:hypothetical protein
MGIAALYRGSSQCRNLTDQLIICWTLCLAPTQQRGQVCGAARWQYIAMGTKIRATRVSTYNCHTLGGAQCAVLAAGRWLGCSWQGRIPAAAAASRVGGAAAASPGEADTSASAAVAGAEAVAVADPLVAAEAGGSDATGAAGPSAAAAGTEVRSAANPVASATGAVAAASDAASDEGG